MTRTNMRIHVAGALLLAALTVTRASPAQAPPAQEAKEHFERGTRHFNIQEWSDAIQEYKTAYKLDARPEYLWALGQTQRLSGDCEGAVRSYQSFIRSGASPQQTAAATELIEKCKATAPAPKGPSAPDPKAEAKRRAEAEAKMRAEAEAKMRAEAEAKMRAEAEARRWYKDPGGHVLFFGGAAGLVVGSVLLVVGNGQVNDANAATDSHAFATLRDGSGSMFQRAGVGALVAGGALAAAGVVRFVVVGHRHGDAKPAPVSVGVLGLGAGIAGRF